MTGVSDPELTETPFLIVAVVSAEMLRAQEEWEVVDTIHPNIGKCRNGAVPHGYQQKPHQPVHM